LIVVDTSVWIDFLRDRPSAAVSELTGLIESGAPLALTGVILTEILQGLPDDDQSAHVEMHLCAFPMVGLAQPEVWPLAAKLYRDARSAGLTISNTTDCMIAAPCIHAGAALLHQDADFDRLAKVSELKVWEF
jgi:predicted nucleic acid-binding protein